MLYYGVEDELGATSSSPVRATGRHAQSRFSAACSRSPCVAVVRRRGWTPPRFSGRKSPRRASDPLKAALKLNSGTTSPLHNRPAALRTRDASGPPAELIDSSPRFREATRTRSSPRESQALEPHANPGGTAAKTSNRRRRWRRPTPNAPRDLQPRPPRWHRERRRTRPPAPPLSVRAS